jgi:hypothetical protein
MAKKSKADREDDDDDSGVKDVSSQLDAIDNDEWEGTEEDDSFSQIPRSKQPAKIDEMVIVKSKSSKKIQIRCACTLASGKYKGRKLWSYLGLTDTDGEADSEEAREVRGRTRASLARLGVDWPAKAKKLPGVIADLEGTYAMLSVTTKEDGGNGFFFDKAIDESEIESDDDEDEKPKKKAKDDDEDDDAKPAKKKSKKADDDDEDDEDEDEKPAKKKKSDDDDDDEDEKPKKSKSDDDDDDDEDEDDEDEPKKKKSKSDDEDEDDDEEEDAKPKKGKAVDEPKVTVKFTDDDLDEDQITKIKKVAKANEFKPKEYDSMTDLICDVAEYVGVEGKFKRFKEIYSAIKEKAE